MGEFRSVDFDGATRYELALLALVYEPEGLSRKLATGADQSYVALHLYRMCHGPNYVTGWT